MTLFYKRLSPALADNEWAPMMAVRNPETPWMRVSPSRNSAGRTGRNTSAESERLKGGVMTKDDRNVLEVLESELDFLTKHGYDRSVRYDFGRYDNGRYDNGRYGYATYEDQW